MPKHENDINSHTPPCYWQDPSVKTATEETLKQGWSTAKIYVNLTESESTLLFLRETIKNPKVIENRQYKQKEKSEGISGKQSDTQIAVNLFERRYFY